MDWTPGMTCQICIKEPCVCIKCGVCHERKAPRYMCMRCYKCREHHHVYNTKDFPHRVCCYKTEITNGTYTINPLRRHLGMELELGYFGRLRTDYPSYRHLPYELVHDGSVAESGRELVTGKVIGDGYVYGMSALVRDLLDTSATVNSTCGYHVHVDAAEFTPLELRKALVIFYLIQNQLYGTLVDSSRKNSWGMEYCPPLVCEPATLMCMETKDEFNTWLHKWLYELALPPKHDFDDPAIYKDTLRRIDTQIKKLKATKYVNRARRWALNFHSWMMRGTLEFRLKEGTVDPSDILMWPLWCGWFVEMCKATHDKEIMLWLKRPPTLMDLAGAMQDIGMPDYVANWVKEKV